ncbi:MAG: (d)CMP kinase [Chloroflexi bacterium]|nr:(d)CMP kinase [Chloroflexota bacterium]
MSASKPAQPQALRVAIDGPVAAGKSTVGRLLAARLGCPFVDTGLIYRAVGYLALQRHTPLENKAALSHLAEESDIRVDDTRVTVDGTEVSPLLRTPEVEAAASRVAQVSGVRRALVRRQWAMAARGPIVMAGRDIGTVVLTDAALKVFLTASDEVRAQRRHEEVSSHGQSTPFAAVLSELKARDRRDKEREASPLVPAPDAHIIDTNSLTPEQVVDAILVLLQSRIPSSPA